MLEPISLPLWKSLGYAFQKHQRQALGSCSPLSSYLLHKPPKQPFRVSFINSGRNHITLKLSGHQSPIDYVGWLMPFGFSANLRREHLPSTSQKLKPSDLPITKAWKSKLIENPPSQLSFQPCFLYLAPLHLTERP